ncbi:glycoside hydrolase family 71 protein [Podospora appendiculata]|uniref:Glycoside hydrolase family 71 protein n=1 Tax=Podospora appendiculata TaxID=314037 RepID=A0AAE1CGX3_9PEZI|nr:glycoside hydrolase family 71 protein [Podospora appendiculata]
MHLLFAIAAALAVCVLPAQAAKEVFAHFLVGNANAFTFAEWQHDMQLAKAASIDGFSLNIAAQDSHNGASLATAFQAADSTGFKLFFSFDYAAQGAWPKDQVIALVNQYASHATYFKPDGTGKPLVTTFEGAGSAADWPSIKAATHCFFMPEWTSIGPRAAAAAANNVADGLASWNAWPVGATNMTTAPDTAFRAALNDNKPYMMPASPWFYTNLPAYGKNWLWRGDQLWDTRWQQIIAQQPDYVQVLTWNDLGESHYIGPVPPGPATSRLFAAAGAPLNYALHNPHDGWRALLPYYIQQYKTGGGGGRNSNAKMIAQDKLVMYYRVNPARACSAAGTTGNNPAFGQAAVPPDQMAADRVFYAALLDAPADVSVAIGGKVYKGVLSPPASGGASGVYTGSVPFAGRLGAVAVAVSRGGKTLVEVEGPGITTACQNGVENWNAVALSAP